jgi:Domain of unknown function (DUF6438)
MRTLPCVLLAAAFANPALAEGPTLQGTYVGENRALPGNGRMEHPMPFPPIRHWRSLVITLERGACFGTCPIYRVGIHGDGRVVFQGQRFVAQTGRRETRISRHAVRRLFAKFRSAEYFSLLDKYHANATDLPTFTISLAFDGHEKTVTDYGGYMIGMPAVVSELERAIDDAARTARWIKAAG